MMGKTLSLISLLMLLCGCFSQGSSWVVDGIAAGDSVFDSTRLRSLDRSPITFEMMKVGEKIHSYLYLNQFHLDQIEPGIVAATFRVGEEIIEKKLPLHEGRMRIPVPEEITEQMILALHRGEKVSILVDTFEKALDPDQFPKFYNRFMGKRALFSNLFKGPME